MGALSTLRLQSGARRFRAHALRGSECRLGSRAFGTSVSLSQERLQELLDAEVVSLGLRNPRPFTLGDILQFTGTVFTGADFPKSAL